MTRVIVTIIILLLYYCYGCYSYCYNSNYISVHERPWTSSGALSSSPRGVWKRTILKRTPADDQSTTMSSDSRRRQSKTTIAAHPQSDSSSDAWRARGTDDNHSYHVEISMQRGHLVLEVFGRPGLATTQGLRFRGSRLKGSRVGEKGLRLFGLRP